MMTTDSIDPELTLLYMCALKKQKKIGKVFMWNNICVVEVDRYRISLFPRNFKPYEITGTITI